ncbi:MAG: hypothetical protein H0V69_05220 [Acidimicrobiia bacterium]|nr:hypothetical protein [Acidimicrobiia bacterium]MDQ3390863.1 hypothetical protein [Actinomycetota bacterium]
MNRFAKLGGLLGIAYCIAGFVLVFLGWNGAASNDSASAQFPYLISGGIAGLGLVVVGAALIVAHSLRTDRVELRGSIDDLRSAVERMSASAGTAVASTGSSAGANRLAGTDNVEGDVVLAGAESYHRTTCSLVADQSDVVAMPLEEAAASGRAACRVCNPGGDA